MHPLLKKILDPLLGNWVEICRVREVFIASQIPYFLKIIIAVPRLTLWWRPATIKKPHFSPIPILWTGFRLIRIRMTKNKFCKKRHFFWLIGRFFFVANLFLSFSVALFFPLPLFFISSFVSHFIVFLLHGIVADQLFRKGTNLIFKV